VGREGGWGLWRGLREFKRVWVVGEGDEGELMALG
jgi:hypothetical protein